MKFKIKIDWRNMWYSVLIWFLAIVIGSFVILPWFYLVMPVVILGTIIFYFKKPFFEVLPARRRMKQSDRIFALGLWVAIFWFLVILALNILEIIGPYYSNVHYYFSDFRNWFLYPLVLLMPVIYSLVLENNRKKRSSRRKNHRVFPFFRYHVHA